MDAIAQIELELDPFDVGLDRGLLDHQGSANLAIGLSAGHQLQNLELAGRQLSQLSD